MPDLLVDPVTLSIILGTIMPILVAFVTKSITHPGIKAVILALLAAGIGVLASAQDHGGLITKETLIFGAVAWVTAVATHFGLLKPAQITGSEGIIQQKTDKVGI